MTPRKRAPQTHPALAVARAEAGRPSSRRRQPVTEPMAAVTVPAAPAVLVHAVLTSPDDPPIYREVWDALYGLPAAPGGEVMADTRPGV